MQVNNYGIATWLRRCARVCEEVAFCQSGKSPAMLDHDKKNIRHFIDALRAYRDYLEAEPEVPYPETHEDIYDIEDLQNFDLVENENVNDITHAFTKMYREVANSQSAKQAANILGFDVKAMELYFQQIENLMDNYVEDYTPLNLAQSSPRRANVKAGKRGATT